MTDFIERLQQQEGFEKVEVVTGLRSHSFDILVICFRPDDAKPIVPFGLSLQGFSEGCAIERKLWCPDNVGLQYDEPTKDGPRPHAPYIAFDHNGEMFSPYSLDTSAYVFTVQSLVDLMGELYEYANV